MPPLRRTSNSVTLIVRGEKRVSALEGHHGKTQGEVVDSGSQQLKRAITNDKGEVVVRKGW